MNWWHLNFNSKPNCANFQWKEHEQSTCNGLTRQWASTWRIPAQSNQERRLRCYWLQVACIPTVTFVTNLNHGSESMWMFIRFLNEFDLFMLKDFFQQCCLALASSRDRETEALQQLMLRCPGFLPSSKKNAGFLSWPARCMFHRTTW